MKTKFLNTGLVCFADRNGRINVMTRSEYQRITNTKSLWNKITTNFKKLIK